MKSTLGAWSRKGEVLWGPQWTILLKLEMPLRMAGSHREQENSKMWNQKENVASNQGTCFATIQTSVSSSSMASWSQRDSSWGFGLDPQIRGSLLLAILALELGSSDNNLMKGKNSQGWKVEREKMSLFWNFKRVLFKHLVFDKQEAELCSVWWVWCLGGYQVQVPKWGPQNKTVRLNRKLMREERVLKTGYVIYMK